MARNGHPRVPRKIRGERRRTQRLLAQRVNERRRFIPHVPNRPLADWERAILRSNPTVEKYAKTTLGEGVLAEKYAHGVQLTGDIMRDVYSPALRQMLAAAPYTKTFGPMSAAMDR